MDRDSAQLLGFLAFIFVLFFAVSVFFVAGRKPFERWLDRIFPGGNSSRQISKDFRITVDPVGDAEKFDAADSSVNPLAAVPDSAPAPPDASPRLEGPRRELYLQSWRQIQDLFSRSPATAVREADRLLAELIPATGQQAIPLQETHLTERDIGETPGKMRDVIRLAQNAGGAARGIAHARQHEEASIEDLELAMDHYRQIFDRLLL